MNVDGRSKGSPQPSNMESKGYEWESPLDPYRDQPALKTPTGKKCSHNMRTKDHKIKVTWSGSSGKGFEGHHFGMGVSQKIHGVPYLNLMLSKLCQKTSLPLLSCPKEGNSKVNKRRFLLAMKISLIPKKQRWIRNIRHANIVSMYKNQ